MPRFEAIDSEITEPTKGERNRDLQRGEEVRQRARQPDFDDDVARLGPERTENVLHLRLHRAKSVATLTATGKKLIRNVGEHGRHHADAEPEDQTGTIATLGSN
jgi:hypothetical protein